MNRPGRRGCFRLPVNVICQGEKNAESHLIAQTERVLEENPELPFDAVSEFWFDDNEARMAAFSTPEGRAAAEDAAAHCAARIHLLTEEKVIID